jgi:DNA modification methylase
MQVLGGNQRLAAIKALNMKEIPDTWVKPASELDDTEKQRFIVQDNHQSGEWDFDILEMDFDAEMLGDIGIELPEFNVDEPEAQEDDYEAPEDVQTIETIIKRSDIIEIGRHRLMCGDSTSERDVAVLMNGEKTNLMLTSPPYFNQREYSQWQDFESYMFSMNRAAYNAIMEKHGIIFWNIGDDSLNHQHISAKHSNMLDLCFTYIDAIIWKKQGVTGIRLAHQKTHNKYYPGFCFEMCLVYQNELGEFPTFENKFKDVIPLTNVWEIATDPNNEKKHSAPYPVKLPATAIMCYTNDKLLNVYDPFIGSGTTMVACHQLDRICFGMEISPQYCQVVVDRMRKLDPDIEVKINGELQD